MNWAKTVQPDNKDELHQAFYIVQPDEGGQLFEVGDNSGSMMSRLCFPR